MSNISASDYTRPSSTMGELPEEILRQIFIMALPPDDHLEDDLFIARAQTIALPIHLSHVCRFWRQVSISLRELWASISLSVDVIPQHKLEMTVEIFDTFLERSRGHPLNFHIRCNMRCEEDYFKRKEVEHIIEATLEQQHLWEHVSFHWEDVKLPVGFKCFGDFRIGDAPLLRTLKLHTSLMKPTADEWIRYEPHSSTIDISHCPRIEPLTLDGEFVLKFGQATNNSLAECTLTPFPEPSSAWCAHMCMDALRYAPTLQSLSISNERHSEALPTFQSDEVVHGLRKLSIGYGSSVEVVLDSVHLPDLREFHYSDCMWGSPTRALRSLQFLQRTRPVLACLAIHGRYIMEDTVLDMLRTQPALSELDLGLNTATLNKVLRALDLMNRAGWFAIEDDESVLCLQLRTIRIHKARSAQEWRTLRALFPMISSRYSQLRTLGLVHIQNKQKDMEVSRHAVMGFGDLDTLFRSATYIRVETVEVSDAHLWTPFI